MYKKALLLTAAALLGCMAHALPAAADPISGDVNGDGAVTVTDISKTAAHVKSIKMLEDTQLACADVNADSSVNVTDISLIAAHVKGMKSLTPAAPATADESFEGCDAFLMFADSDMNWGNWNGQGYVGVPSFGTDADVTADGTYTVSIERDKMLAADDAGSNESLIYDSVWGWDTEESLLRDAYGCTMFCVDITGLLDGTLAADGAELEGFLEDGNDAGINKKVRGSFRGDELKVEVVSITADGREIAFDPDKVKYGNLDEEDNCYRIEIANLLTGTAEDAAIDPDDLYFSDELSVTFTISGMGETAKHGDDAVNVIGKYFDAVFIDHDFDTAFGLKVPDDMYSDIEARELSEYDDPPADFDLYTYEKRDFDKGFPAERNYSYEILACEELSKAANGKVNEVINGELSPDSIDYWDILGYADFTDLADEGTDVYAAAVRWGYTETGDDEYSETELVYVYCRNSNWYIYTDEI